MDKMVDFYSMSPEMTKDLNNIAEKYRKPYTEFIDELSDLYDDDTGFWWDTPLASRNVYLSWCFQDICVLRLILDYASKFDLDEIVVSCDEIKEAVMCNRKDMRIHVPARGRHNRELYLNRTNQEFCQFQKKISDIQKYRRNEHLDEFQGRDIILVGTYRIAAETKDGVLRDRYFSGLQENCDEDIVFLSTCGTIQKGEKQLLDVLHDMDNHICMEDWVEKQDFREIQRYIQWSQSVKVLPCSFDGMDVTSLIEAALLAGSGSQNVMYGIARGEALCRIVDRYELNIKCLMDWFEGQPSSHATIRRFRKKYPNIPTVACSQFPYGENNLGQYPSARQIEKNIVPKCFGVLGKIWVNQVCQFSKHLKCVIIPSFRHNHVFLKKKDMSLERKGILLILPIFKDCSTQLLEAFGEAIQGLNARSVGPIYIKNHPVNQNMRYSDYGVNENLFRNFDVSYLTGDIADAMEGKAIVILSKTTSTLETMLSGVYTVSFVPNGDLVTTALPDVVKENVKISYNAEDLRACLQFPQRGLSSKKIDWFREMSFTQVNRKTVTEFLQLCCVKK